MHARYEAKLPAPPLQWNDHSFIHSFNLRVIGILKKQDNAITSRTARQKTALMLLSRKYAMQIEYSKAHTQYCNIDLITELVRVGQLAVIKDFLSVGLMLIIIII